MLAGILRVGSLFKWGLPPLEGQGADRWNFQLKAGSFRP
jgi:hypothetical protein